MQILRSHLAVAALSLILVTSVLAETTEHVVLERSGQRIHTAGRLIVEAQDGGVLLLSNDGQLWPIQSEELKSREKEERKFKALTKSEIAKQLLQEMPEGFQIHTTAHYVICYNTSNVYAQWCGSLYERLYRGFYGYWKYRGIELEEPEFPLVAMIFNDRGGYMQFSRPELGESIESIIGYYNMRTNRVVMYDLTGADNIRPNRNIRSTTHINQILSQPAAERNVATIVHEATHQLAFNSGLQVRFADIPFWVSEGIAVYFETPDLSNPKGWKTIGGVNKTILLNFRNSLNNRPPNALEALLSDDARFRDPKQSAAAYAEAWALNYFLLKTREDDYVAYLKKMAEQTPLIELGAEKRVAQFKQAFGNDLDELNATFLRFMRRVSPRR
ncbi:MAG: hypothetical protein ACI9G1_001910 [Pirellulaceae bacterium]